MAELQGKHIIKALQKKWQLQQLLASVFISFAFSFLTTAILHVLLLISLWWMIVIFIFSLTLLLFTAAWRIKEADVAIYLNKIFPELEESTSLLLSNVNNLNFLQRLQITKVDATLQGLPALHPVKKKLLFSFIILVCSVIVSCILLSTIFSFKQLSFNKNKLVVKEKVLPQIASFSIKIIPPAYTNQSVKEEHQFNLVVEEGATIVWHIATNIAVEKVAIVFNDSATVYLKNDATKNEWAYQNIFIKSGFYQLKINDTNSELYKIEVIKDQPPTITVQTPRPNTVIDYGQPKKVVTNVLLHDDYGIADAFINATTASGSGESVKFKEQKIAFTNTFNQHQLQYQLQQTINLVQLDMQPGDELYFYIQATDNHNQQTRSDIYKVVIADTAQLMNIDGFANAVNIKPDYFRSERQIIIETEQLLRDKDTITTEHFNNKSNDLAVDQKLLRLRYGKYLGEENESNIDPKDIEGLDATEFGDATKMIDAFTDKHDNAEDATFLDPQTKKKLKAVLNEMWAAELKLHLYKPQEALPFAYKALRLLKELQQSQRAYVAKTSYKTPTPKLEKRLTADLSKIISPTTNKQNSINTKQETIVRNAISVLEEIKSGEPLNIFSIEILEQAAQQLSSKAAADPSGYLFSYNALQKILQSVTDKKTIYPITIDAAWAEYSLQKMLPVPTALPQQTIINSNQFLSDEYFKKLNRNNK